MRLGDLAPPCACVRAPRRQLGALAYHSYGDVAAEKIRINAVVSQTVAAWNACSADASDNTAAQLSTDFNAWYTTWTDFTNTGSSNVADFPDNDEWDTMATYEAQLAALTARINAYCGAGLPGPAPVSKTPINPLYVLAPVIGLAALAVVLGEAEPIIKGAGELAAGIIDGVRDLIDDVTG